MIMECGIMYLKFGLKMMILAVSMTFQNLTGVNISQKQRMKNCKVLFTTYAKINKPMKRRFQERRSYDIS